MNVTSNDITHIIFEDFNADKLTDETIWSKRQYGVKDVMFYFIFVKSSIKLGKMISEENEFLFVSNGNILRKHLCKDGVLLTDEGINIFA